MTHEQHFRKRQKDAINLCVCKNCFALKCLKPENHIISYCITVFRSLYNDETSVATLEN